ASASWRFRLGERRPTSQPACPVLSRAAAALPGRTSPWKPLQGPEVAGGASESSFVTSLQEFRQVVGRFLGAHDRKFLDAAALEGTVLFGFGGSQQAGAVAGEHVGTQDGALDAFVAGPGVDALKHGV